VEIPNEGYTQRWIAVPTSMVRNMLVRVPRDRTPLKAAKKKPKRKRAKNRQPVKWV
jgi:hypothetical protein